MLQRSRLMQVMGVCRLAGRSARSALALPFCSAWLLEASRRCQGSLLCCGSLSRLSGEYRLCSLLKYLCPSTSFQLHSVTLCHGFSGMSWNILNSKAAVKVSRPTGRSNTPQSYGAYCAVQYRD